MTIKAADLQKAGNLARERDDMLKIIALAERAEGFVLKDAGDRLFSETGQHQLTVGASFIRDGVLKWARAELMLTEGALELLVRLITHEAQR